MAWPAEAAQHNAKSSNRAAKRDILDHETMEWSILWHLQPEPGRELRKSSKSPEICPCRVNLGQFHAFFVSGSAMACFSGIFPNHWRYS